MAKMQSNILDQYGRPIEYDIMDKEFAVPTVSSVRSLMPSEGFQNLTPERIARMLKSALSGDTSAYFDMAEEIEEKYWHYAGVLGTRKRQVSQLDISVTPASDDPNHIKHADLIREWLERDVLQAELFDILDAVGKGISYTEIIWDIKPDKWLPKTLKRRDPKWFGFAKDGETPMLRGEQNELLPLPAYKFITHVHSAKSGLPIRGGLARSIVWAYLFQSFAIKDWVIFAEVFGMPIRIGKYGANATAADRAKLLQAVRNISTDAAAIIPDSMNIVFEGGTSTGSVDIYERLCQYLDQQVSKAVLGQTATTDATAGGLGGSQGNVHNEVREDIERADSGLLSATLNRDIVQPIININFGPQADGRYPRIKIGRGEQLTPAEVDMITKLVPYGLRVSLSQIYAKAGLVEPKPDEEVLGVQNQTVPNSPQDAQGGQSGATVAKKDKVALLGASKASNGVNLDAASSANTDGIEMDAIDNAIADISDDNWSEIMTPYSDAISQALESASSFDEFKNNLIPALDKMDPTKMAEVLAKFGFVLRLKGETGEEI